MDLLHQQVYHQTFGTGRIVRQEADMLTVSFPEHGEKRFHYPDAFEKFLEPCDPAVRIALAAEQGKQELFDKYMQHKSSL